MNRTVRLVEAEFGDLQRTVALQDWERLSMRGGQRAGGRGGPASEHARLVRAFVRMLAPGGCTCMMSMARQSSAGSISASLPSK